MIKVLSTINDMSKTTDLCLQCFDKISQLLDKHEKILQAHSWLIQEKLRRENDGNSNK